MLVTGDEILRGRIQERNAGVLARSLESHGVGVERIEMVGDGADVIASALVRLLGEGVDVVCVSGGLGPTHDDLTMDAVARATGRPLALDRAALGLVRARSAGMGGDPAVRRSVQQKQASLPEGARVLPPPGTAPGCVLRHGGAVVVVLPGPPWELEAMWADALATPEVAGVVARAGARHERVLRLEAVPESRLVGVLRGLDRGAWERLRVGVCARDGELEVTVRADPSDAWAAAALEQAVAAEMGDALFSRDGASLDAVVADALLEAGETVAVAESCTGGGLGARLTERAGSSAYALGGVIAYADAVKTALLGVGTELLRRHGAVSPECARAMALGARERLGADWALSVTGIAGPGGGTPEKPVGLVYVGIAGPGGLVDHAELRGGGDRAAIRRRSGTAALHLLRRSLAGRVAAA